MIIGGAFDDDKLYPVGLEPINGSQSICAVLAELSGFQVALYRRVPGTLAFGYKFFLFLMTFRFSPLVYVTRFTCE